MVLDIPRGLRKNAPGRVAVRTAMQAQLRWKPGGTGRRLAGVPRAGEGHFREDRTGSCPRVLRAPPWTQKSSCWLLLPTHTAAVLCALCPPNVKSHRCSLLPSAGSRFPQSPFLSPVSRILLLPIGKSGPSGDSLSCTEGESGALPTHPVG